ncbi:UDP-Glycosyltransferase/glycogen phosphorylase [Hesseltinella vesiculosa]|uniref:UDP-Glycosyltransferase/glycogen phosphorylase n=1 Tax=Hesseltinella vesiculosa TaxID=101127 RepID=A0A1X2GS14_9FUNG|nr:UDP-Glycosyltransferase/glycogen phosphorylase [Hesseltinella vesiculosa]
MRSLKLGLFIVAYAYAACLSLALELTETYQSPRSILFAATVGGSSHANWVLDIMNQLHARGHRIAFATNDDHVRFGHMANIKTISMGPSTIPKDSLIHQDNAHLDPQHVMGTLIGQIIDAYPNEYTSLVRIMQEEKADLAICDHFVDPCMEAAQQLGLPFIVTSTLAIAPGNAHLRSKVDASASYVSSGIGLYGVHNGQIGFWDRVYYNYLFMPKFIWSHLSTLMRMANVKESVGLVPAMDMMASWQHSLKMVNTAFGLENARPLGPLVEFLGPILPRNYAPLTDDMLSFLDAHARVVYVAFGQKAIPSMDDRQLLWTALLSLLDTHTFDGLVWVDGHFDQLPSDFQVTTSNRTYTTHDLKTHPHISLSKWAPQVAILLHRSTSLFLTHGGAGSLHEALYAMVPMAVFPFVGDQMGLARNIEAQGLGVFLDRSRPEMIMEKLQLPLKNSSIQKRVQQYGASVQIHAKHAVTRGADLVEEVLCTWDPERRLLPHRHQASFDLPWIVTYNVDVYLFFSTSLAVVAWSTVRLAQRLRPTKAKLD